MDVETQRLLRKVVARMDESHQFTGELSEDELTELIELEMRDDDEPDAFVAAPRGSPSRIRKAPGPLRSPSPTISIPSI